MTPRTFDEFWPYYVSQHLNPRNQFLHAAGTLAALVLTCAALIWRAPFVAVAAVVAGYGLAWIGHFFYERNTPATFRHPLLSLRGDFRMCLLIVRGEMGTEILLLTKELKALRG